MDVAHLISEVWQVSYLRDMEDSQICGHLRSPCSIHKQPQVIQIQPMPKANLLSNGWKSRFSFPSPGEERRIILETHGASEVYAEECRTGDPYLTPLHLLG